MAFFIAKDKLSLNRLLRLAKISRSTLYRHHKNLQEIAPDYEKYILKKCKKAMKPLMIDEELSIAAIYQRILVFMVANRFIMKFLLKYGSQNLFERIVFAIKPKVLATNKVADGEMYKIYAKEVSAIIEEWGRAGFKKTGIIPVTNKISYITDQANIRLSPLNAFNQP